MNSLYYSHIDSPVGRLLIAGDDESLRFLSFASGHKAFDPHPEWQPRDAVFVEAKRQLRAYFAGELRSFELPYRLGGTEFQQRVWRALARIPYGETLSYGELARVIGAPSASRAVGAANGNNPLPVILPCHRVIGADGSLTGFGGGVETKAWLLRHEAETAAAQIPMFD